MDDARVTSRWARSAAAVLAVCSLVLHIGVSSRLGRTGVLHEWDVLFNADPTVYMTSFTTGENTSRWGGRSFVHPNISNVIYPVVTTLAATVHRVRPSIPAQSAARRIGYAICPVASAATSAILLFAFIELGVSLGGAVLLVLLYLVSFSGLVFSSIPESYCLTAFAFAVLFRLAARTLRSGPRGVDARHWTAVGTLMASITITNLASFALVACAVRLRQGSLRRAVLWTGGVSATALLITVAFYAIGARLSTTAPAFTPTATGQVSELHPFEVGSALVEFPAALANTFTPPAPLKERGDPLLRQEMRFTLTYHDPEHPPPGQGWRTVLVLLLLALALLSAAYLSANQRALVIAAVLIVAFNWMLHTFYGSEMFLYSQHWGIPLLVILLGLVAGKGPYPTLRRALVAGMIVLAAWNSVAVWRAVLGLLEHPPMEQAAAELPPAS